MLNYNYNYTATVDTNVATTVTVTVPDFHLSRIHAAPIPLLNFPKRSVIRKGNRIIYIMVPLNFI